MVLFTEKLHNSSNSTLSEAYEIKFNKITNNFLQKMVIESNNSIFKDTNVKKQNVKEDENTILNETKIDINIEKIREQSDSDDIISKNDIGTLEDFLGVLPCCAPCSCFIYTMVSIASSLLIIAFACIYYWFITISNNPRVIILKIVRNEVWYIIGLLCVITLISLRHKYFRKIMFILVGTACFLISLNVIVVTIKFNICKELLFALEQLKKNNEYSFLSFNLVKRTIFGVTDWLLNMDWAKTCKNIVAEE